jgi:hypothetical protein
MKNPYNPERRLSQLYRDFSLPVQLYHAYDVWLEDYLSLSEEELRRRVLQSHMAHAVILSDMSDEEYEELQDSMKGHIIQARIRLSEDRKFIQSIYDPGLINRIQDHIHKTEE